STAVGNMPEFVRHGHNGFLVPRDPAALQATLADLTRWPPADRNALGAEARRTALAWGWELQVERFRALFAAALAPGPVAPPPARAIAIVALGDDEPTLRRAAAAAFGALLEHGAEVAAAPARGGHAARLAAAAAATPLPWLCAIYRPVP